MHVHVHVYVFVGACVYVHLCACVCPCVESEDRLACCSCEKLSTSFKAGSLTGLKQLLSSLNVDNRN